MARGLGRLASIASSIGLLAGTANAEPREKLEIAVFAVAKDPSGQKVAAALSALLRTQAAATDGLRLVEPGRRLAGDPKTQEEQTLDRARAALADGRRAYDALGLDDAIARLGQAISFYQQSGPLLGDLAELTSALAYLGAALVLRGSAEEATSTFVELLTIDPAYTLDGFPPAVLEVFDRAVEQSKSLPTGEAEIYSTPPNAAIFLDGRFAGVTPFSVGGLRTGSHFLRLEKDGFVIHGGPIEVAEKQKITSQTRLVSIQKGTELRDLLARAAPEVGESPEGMGGTLRALGRLLVVDALVVVSAAQSGADASFVGAVFDARAGNRLATERAVFPAEGPTFRRDAAELARKLLERAATGVAVAASPGGSGGNLGLSPGAGVQPGGGAGSAPPPAGVVTEPTSNDPPTKAGTIVGIGLLGLAGAAAISGIVLGSLALVTKSDYTNTPQASPDLPTIRSDGRTKALVADISFGVAAGAGIAGLVTLLVSQGQEPTPAELLGAPRASIDLLPGGAALTVGGTFR